MLLWTASMAATASNQYVDDCVTLTLDSTKGKERGGERKRLESEKVKGSMRER